MDGLPPDASEREAQAYIDRQLGRPAEGIGLSFAITEAGTGRAVGSIGLWLQGLAQGRATVGYAVTASARGSGLAAAALTALTSYAAAVAGTCSATRPSGRTLPESPRPGRGRPRRGHY